MKKHILMILVLALAVQLLTGCGDLSNKLIGSWEANGQVITFYDDGTVQLSGEYGTWSIVNDNQLKITLRVTAIREDNMIVTISDINRNSMTWITENETATLSRIE